MAITQGPATDAGPAAAAASNAPNASDVGEASVDAGPDPQVGAAGIKPRARLGPRRRQIIAFGVLAAALGVLIFRGLGNATLYFKTADEAVAQRAQLGERRFRIEGTVQPGVRQLGPDDVAFVIENNGASVNVIHHNGSPQLFKAGIPVVLEGNFTADGHFASDLIMVKHSSSYVAAHPERVTTVPQPAPAPAP
jgi:cytochrome c-type biogenesis protein CcmE